MFRSSMREFRLFESRLARAAAPSFKPAVEVLEERVVLNAASGRAAISAKALPPIAPAVATQQLLSIITSSLNQYASLQARLIAVAGKMDARPAGAARQPLVPQVKNLVTGFLKKEKIRFHKFQVLAKRVVGSDLFKSAAGLYTSVHQSFSLLNRQVQLFTWLSDTTFRAVSFAKALERGSDPLPTPKEAPGRVSIRVLRTALTVDDADLLLFRLALLFDSLATNLPPAPSTKNACTTKAYKETLDERDDTLDIIGLLALGVALSGSKSGFDFFRSVAKAANTEFQAAKKMAADEASFYASVTRAQAHMALPTEPTQLTFPELQIP
jgi:hypothetical protein